ncbi:MAG TPA: hypothetical protein VKV15_03950 [Bryobacteraceae bacterium]|nr:hypothetical protein [Bryobacteraceae bacterium]
MEQQEWAMVTLPLPADPFWRLALLAQRADLSASLDSMLISSLHVQAPKDLERVVKLRAALYGYSAVATAERARGTSPSFLARADSQDFGEADTGFPDCARNEPKF